MSPILESIWQGMIGASALEQVGTVLGIIGVGLMIRRKIWAFPVGLIQVAIFGWVCFEGKLYSETVLQGIFFAALAYGWWHWTHPDGREVQELPIQRLTSVQALAWSAGTLLLWGVWGSAMARLTNAALPYWDGFVFAASVASQWLQARKVLANWIGWLIANTVAIGVFWTKEYYWFAVLYGIFWCMSLGGLKAWLKAWKEQESDA
ncbi:MAG: nicotinamide riboside transporter PnuC [Opitutaceae bacterium]